MHLAACLFTWCTEFNNGGITFAPGAKKINGQEEKKYSVNPIKMIHYNNHDYNDWQRVPAKNTSKNAKVCSLIKKDATVQGYGSIFLRLMTEVHLSKWDVSSVR